MIRRRSTPFHPLRLALVSLIFSALLACKPQVEDLHLDDPKDSQVGVNRRIAFANPIYTHSLYAGDSAADAFVQDPLGLAFFKLTDPTSALEYSDLTGNIGSDRFEYYLAIDGLDDTITIVGSDALEPHKDFNKTHDAIYSAADFAYIQRNTLAITAPIDQPKTLTFTLYYVSYNANDIDNTFSYARVSEAHSMQVITCDQPPKLTFTMPTYFAPQFPNKGFSSVRFILKDVRINGNVIGDRNTWLLQHKYDLLDANGISLIPPSGSTSGLPFVLFHNRSTPISSSTLQRDIEMEITSNSPNLGRYTLLFWFTLAGMPISEATPIALEVFEGVGIR